MDKRPDPGPTHQLGKRKSELERESKQSASRQAGVINKGEWVTHISLPIEFEKSHLDFINGLKIRLKEKFLDLVDDVIECDEFHLSVSRTFRIKKSQIVELTKCIDEKFASKSKFKCNFGETVLFKSGLFGGEEKRKFFLAFKIDPTSDANDFDLNSLLIDLNSCLKSLNLPEYYKNPTFHISFSYVKLKEDHSDQELKTILDNLRREIKGFENDQSPETWDQQKHLEIKRLKIKCGNNISFIKLK